MTNHILAWAQSTPGDGKSHKTCVTATANGEIRVAAQKIDAATLAPIVPNFRTPHFRQIDDSRGLTGNVAALFGNVANEIGNVAGLIGNVADLFANVFALFGNVLELLVNVQPSEIHVTPSFADF